MNNNKIVSIFAVSALLLGACGAEGTQDEETQSDTNETLTIEDSANNVVDVPEDPERVAVFDNGQLDNIDALGFGDRVAATATDDLPAHLEQYSDVPVAGTLHDIDLETTYSENPDLAITAGRSSDSTSELSEFVPSIDLSNNTGDYWESLTTNLERLGTIFGAEEEANEIRANLENQMTQLNEEASSSDLSTLVLMFNEGDLSAYGPGSRFGVVHDTFGFEPVDDTIEASNHGMDVSYEYVLEQDPDVIFVIDRTSAIGGDETSETFEENPLIQEAQAYEDDNIVYLSPDIWYLTEGGTQAFETMMEEVSEPLNE